MKKNYKKIVQKKYFNPYIGEWKDQYHKRLLGKYSIKYEYYRSVATQNERRQNCWAQDDGYHVRGRRRYKHLITKWDDPRIGRDWKRSWKDFTKCKKQYMVNIK